jgi:hypothetical protein
MHRLGIVSTALLVCASACGTHRPNLAPQIAELRVKTGAPPRSAIRAAALQLANSGFLIVDIDSVAGLRAEREHESGVLGNTVACRTASVPGLRASITPTLIIEVAAQQRPDGGSELLLASRVHTFYLRLTADPARPSNDSDCRSTGVVERQLAEFLTGAV